MPIGAEKIDTLKADIAVARKRPLAFGLCLGKSPETTVLINHKTKEPEALGRQAKKEGETSKFTFGTMEVDGKNLNLSCHGDVPTGLARKAKDMLKAAGMKLKVRILDAEGNLFEEDGDDEEEGEEGEGEAVADTGETGGGEAPQEDPDKPKWEEFLVNLGPRIEGMRDARTPEVKKLVAYWAFALSKAQANPPDYAAAVKSAATVAKSLEAAAPQAPAPDETPVDARDEARALRLRSRELDRLEAELRLLNLAYA